MTLNLGTTGVNAAYAGSTALSKIYVGATQIWPTVGISYSDNFDRADGILTSPWTGASMPNIVSNRVKATRATTKFAIYSLPYTTLSQSVQGDWTYEGDSYASGEGVLMARYKDTSNYIGLSYAVNGGASYLQIFSVIGGTTTSRANKTFVSSSGIRLTCEGNVYRAYTGLSTLELTWTDSGNLFPSTDPSYNKAGFSVYSVTNGGPGGTASDMYLDNFAMADI